MIIQYQETTVALGSCRFSIILCLKGKKMKNVNGKSVCLTAKVYFTYRNKIMCSKSIDGDDARNIYYLSFNECPLFVKHCVKNFTHTV